MHNKARDFLTSRMFHLSNGIYFFQETALRTAFYMFLKMLFNIFPKYKIKTRGYRKTFHHDLHNLTCKINVNSIHPFPTLLEISQVYFPFTINKNQI